MTIRRLVSLSRLYNEVGRKDKADAYLNQARKMMDTLIKVSWDDEDGCFFPRWDIENPKLSKRTTCASLLPLITGLVPEDKAKRLINEHLLNPREFWLDYVVPFNAQDELDRENLYLENVMLWRGHCIWANMNWMVVQGLKEYGYHEQATEIARRTALMIRASGFYEFYDPRTGRGAGAQNFTWPGLVLDMI